MSDDLSRSFREQRIKDATPKTEAERLERIQALETFSFVKAGRLVDTLGEIQFAAWQAGRMLDEVRISAIYSSDPPPLDWRDPIQRSLANDLEEERPVARLEVSKRMLDLRQGLRSLRDLVDRTLVEEAIP
jgi:hypothetical protein